MSSGSSAELKLLTKRVQDLDKEYNQFMNDVSKILKSEPKKPLIRGKPRESSFLRMHLSNLKHRAEESHRRMKENYEDLKRNSRGWTFDEWTFDERRNFNNIMNGNLDYNYKAIYADGTPISQDIVLPSKVLSKQVYTSLDRYKNNADWIKSKMEDEAKKTIRNHPIFNNYLHNHIAPIVEHPSRITKKMLPYVYLPKPEFSLAELSKILNEAYPNPNKSNPRKRKQRSSSLTLRKKKRTVKRKSHSGSKSSSKSRTPKRRRMV